MNFRHKDDDASQLFAKGGKIPPMKVTRRQFLKVTAGAIGATVAAEAVSLGADVSAIQKSAQGVPIKTGKQIPSICPYCSVGCGQIVTINDKGAITDIQGNPDSPISEGTLCPKGAATYQLVMNDLRWTKVKYRAPGSDHWEDRPLDWAIDRVAELVKQTRDAHFNEFEEITDDKGQRVKKRAMNTHAIASLGGATISNEWNYAQQKLMHGLGVVSVENQARI
jgi:formate dehydrogenase major subunit